MDLTPSTWLGAGYVQDDTNHLIKFNTNDASSNKTLPMLTDALADAATGDVRKVALALCEALWDAWEAQLVAQPNTMPQKMIISRYAQTSRTGEVFWTYQFKFGIIPPTSIALESEPGS